MGKLYTSILMGLTVTVLVAVMSSCSSSPTSGDNKSKAPDESSVEDVTPTVSQTSDIENEPKPENKKATANGEDALSQAIKRQSDNDITKASNDLLMVNPSNVKALNALGLSNYKKGKYKAAEYFFNKALKVSSNEAGLYNNLAMVKLAQNEQREAVKVLKTGLAQKADDVALLSNLGAIYISQKDYPNAEVALEGVVKRGTKDVKVQTNYAVALAANKKYQDASALYKKLLAENSNSREIMLNYSIHLVENMRDYKQGLDLINRLKFVGIPDEARNVIKDLENKAKSGLK